MVKFLSVDEVVFIRIMPDYSTCTGGIPLQKANKFQLKRTGFHMTLSYPEADCCEYRLFLFSAKI